MMREKSEKKPKGLFDGQLYVFACDQNRRGEAEMETNTRPNQSNVVFGPMKRKKGVFYQEMMAIKEKDMDERV